MISEFQGRYRFLSNFWPSRIKWRGIVFRYVENAFQSSKTNLTKTREIIATVGPRAAKHMGSKLPLPPDWENVKEDIMYALLVLKFEHPVLQANLLATGDDELQEGNRWGDTEWGVDLYTGKGENKLGKILMRIRSEIQVRR